MATKSRLGKGLGALFPSLPGEPQHQEHAAPAAAAKEVKASKTDGHVESKSASATAQASVNAVQGMKHAVSRETTKKNQHRRASMPSISLNESAHPADMFFGSTAQPASEQGEQQGSVSRETTPTEHKKDEPELLPVQGGYLVELRLSDVGPNLHQPRTIFDEDDLRELAESIKEVGVLQPIVVRKRPQSQIEAARREAAAKPAEPHNMFDGRMDSMYELIMDAAANQKSKNVEGQMGLFDLLSGEDAPAAMPAIPVPNIPELSAQEKMSLEKQTTGLYLSGHPMDDYRPLLRGMDVVPIGEILECFENGEDTYQDEQIVNIAGIVEAVKMKTTKSGSMMAYVTVEDDTGSMELLVFSGVLGQYGSMLYENSAVILNGRISVRDEKPPQLVVNRVLPIADMQDADVAQAARQAAAQAHTVYLRIEDSAQSSARKVFPVLKMFPGKAKAVVYYADTGARMGGKCAIDERMLREMRELLGEKNVIVK